MAFGRTVAVTLTAQATNYLATMAKAALATEQFASKASKAVSKHEQGIRTLSTTAGLMGGAIALGVGLAAKATADFDKAMSDVAATGEDARSSLTGLRDAALKAGAATKFSATEAAGGIESLAKAGVSAADIMGGGLSGALDLAATGNLDVADSAEVAATAMTQFNLTGRDVPHIADLIAAGAGKAQGEVSDMAMALKQGGLVASQFGLSIEDTTGTLAAFASAGLIGSDAGTSFKTMLLSLASPSKKAQTAMDDLGIAAYDAQGNFVGITQLAEQLKVKLGGLSQAQRDAALSTIFGTDAIRAANVLYKQGGTGIQDWINKTNDSGYAAEAAAIKMDNLRGDIEKLMGALSTTAITTGDADTGPLRILVQDAAALVDMFNELGPTAKSTFLILGAGAAAVLLTAAATGKLVVAANEAKVALNAMGIGMKTAAVGAGVVGAALGVAAIALGAWASKHAESKAAVQEMVGILQGETSAIVENSNAWAAKRLQDQGALEAANRLGISLQDVTAASLGNADALARVNAALDGATVAGARFAANRGDINLLRDAVGGTSQEFNKASNEAHNMASATGGATTAFGGLSNSAGDAAQQLATQQQAAADAAQANKDLVASLFAVQQANLELQGSLDGVEAAYDAATASAKKNGHTLDSHTEKGRANREALRNLAAAGQKYVQNLVEQGAGTKQVTAATQHARSQFIHSAEAMGASSKEAKKLADRLFGIPKDTKAKVSAPGATTATAQAHSLTRQLNAIPRNVTTHVVAVFSTKGYKGFHAALNTPSRVGGLAYGGPVVRRDSGGEIPGYSPHPRADNIPVMATAGEYMQPVNAVQHYGMAAMDAVRERRAVIAYADGGQIQPARNVVERRYAGGGQISGFGVGNSANPVSNVHNVNVHVTMPATGNWEAAAAALGDRIAADMIAQGG